MNSGLDPAEQKAIDTIAQYGWMVMEVSPSKGDNDQRWFAYTVGLAATLGWPELICFGLSQDVMTQLLNNAVAEIKKRRTVPTPGMELTEVIEALPMRLAKFPRTSFREHLGWALWHAHFSGVQAKQFDCLQLQWPDKRGRFPDDPGCTPEIRDLQSVISRMQ
jgi:hypothetical protein